MDKINFIQSHSIKKEYEVRRWFYHSVLSIAILISIISIVQIKQIIHWYTIKQAYKDGKKIMHTFDQLTQKHQAALKEKQFFENRIKRITQLQNKTITHPFFALATIQKKYPDLTLETCSVHHKTVKLMVNSPTYKTIQALIAELRNHTLFKNASLNAMHVDKEKIHATIHASLRYDS